MEKENEDFEVIEGVEEIQEWEHVNFGWIETLSTVLLVLGCLSVVGGAIALMVFLSEGVDVASPAMVGTLVMSGLTLLFMSGVVKVLLKIERNTRL